MTFAYGGQCETCVPPLAEANAAQASAGMELQMQPAPLDPVTA
jgi:hypothetical protein